MAQAVSRWLSTAAARVRVRSCHVGFVVDKVALGYRFLRVLRFPLPLSPFHQFLHHHNRPGQVQYANWWPTSRVDAVGLHPAPPLFKFKNKEFYNNNSVLYIFTRLLNSTNVSYNVTTGKRKKRNSTNKRQQSRLFHSHSNDSSIK
jgi:hypothetical protein